MTKSVVHLLEFIQVDIKNAATLARVAQTAAKAHVHMIEKEGAVR